MTAAVDRLAGYRDALLAAGRDPDEDLSRRATSPRTAARRAMRAAARPRPDIDAVFAANDLMAAGALQVLLEHGRRVPDDVAVVGFDDSPIALTTRPPSPASASRSTSWVASWSAAAAADRGRATVTRKVVLATRADRPAIEWRAA